MFQTLNLAGSNCSFTGGFHLWFPRRRTSTWRSRKPMKMWKPCRFGKAPGSGSIYGRCFPTKLGHNSGVMLGFRFQHHGSHMGLWRLWFGKNTGCCWTVPMNPQSCGGPVLPFHPGKSQCIWAKKHRMLGSYVVAHPRTPKWLTCSNPSYKWITIW